MLESGYFQPVNRLSCAKTALTAKITYLDGSEVSGFYTTGRVFLQISILAKHL